MIFPTLLKVAPQICDHIHMYTEPYISGKKKKVKTNKQDHMRTIDAQKTEITDCLTQCDMTDTRDGPLDIGGGGAGDFPRDKLFFCTSYFFKVT